MEERATPVVWVDPQVAELVRQLDAAETALLDAEVDLATLRVELDNLAIVHHRRLGPLYERLDELDALVAEAVAARTGDPEDIRRALHARAIVEPMPDLDELMDAFGELGGDGRQAAEAVAPEVHRVKTDENARRLFRDLARRAHPDLVQDPAEKERRGAFIARVNTAYARGDVQALLALDAEWAAGPDEAPAPGTQDHAAWLRLRLDRLAQRLDEIERARTELLESPMAQLMRMAPHDPDGLLEQLAEELLQRIDARERELASLLGA